MFSKKCEYGIRALTVIGQASKDGRKIGIKEICQIAETPESFTAKILQALVKRGVVNSMKGPTGGFYFSQNLDEVSLYDIVEAIDGDSMFRKCGLGLSKCNAKRPCPLHSKFEVVRNGLLEMCNNNNLSDLLGEYHIDVYKR